MAKQKAKTIIKQRIEDLFSPNVDLTKIEQLGIRLVHLRKSKGFTQAQITAVSGLTPTRIIDIERGRTNYTIESFLTYLEAIKCSFSDLIPIRINEKPILINWSNEELSDWPIKPKNTGKSIIDLLNNNSGPGAGKTFIQKKTKKR